MFVKFSADESEEGRDIGDERGRRRDIGCCTIGCVVEVAATCCAHVGVDGGGLTEEGEDRGRGSRDHLRVVGGVPRSLRLQ